MFDLSLIQAEWDKPITQHIRGILDQLILSPDEKIWGRLRTIPREVIPGGTVGEEVKLLCKLYPDDADVAVVTDGQYSYFENVRHYTKHFTSRLIIYCDSSLTQTIIRHLRKLSGASDVEIYRTRGNLTLHDVLYVNFEHETVHRNNTSYVIFSAGVILFSVIMGLLLSHCSRNFRQ
jgi:hypothetical protein